MGENSQRFFSSPGALLVGVRIFSAREWRSDIFFLYATKIFQRYGHSKVISLGIYIPVVENYF